MTANQELYLNPVTQFSQDEPVKATLKWLKDFFRFLFLVRVHTSKEEHQWLQSLAF